MANPVDLVGWRTKHEARLAYDPYVRCEDPSSSAIWDITQQKWRYVPSDTSSPAIVHSTREELEPEPRLWGKRKCLRISSRYPRIIKRDTNKEDRYQKAERLFKQYADEEERRRKRCPARRQ